MVRPYAAADYPQLEAWCKARGLPAIPKHALPATGFIVDDVGAAFLYKTDSSMAVIDCMVSNPASAPTVRGEALDLIIRRLIEQARALGFKAIKSETKNTSVRARALSAGFYDCGAHSCLYLEL